MELLLTGLEMRVKLAKKGHDFPPGLSTITEHYLVLLLFVKKYCCKSGAIFYILKMTEDDRELWSAADTNQDGILAGDEWVTFSNPEEHPSMLPIIMNQTLRDKDKDHDGAISFQEYVASRGESQDKGWLTEEKDRFDNELDTNKDGQLTGNEITSWMVPSNE